MAVSRDSLHLRCDVESSRGAQVPQPHHHPKRHLMRTHMRRREQPDHGGVGLAIRVPAHPIRGVEQDGAVSV